MELVLLHLGAVKRCDVLSHHEYCILARLESSNPVATMLDAAFSTLATQSRFHDR